MDLNTALFIFVLVAALIFVTARAARIKVFSALALALLVAYLVLITIRPWHSVEGFVEGNFNALIYLLITLLVPLILIFYVIAKALNDRQC